ncbi:hypothetical protein DYB37_003732 [Aphanomyces astaci]|uniref:Uncharacterized protein n=1 Tax=Aphanomyces astaci TaxID=112090 RepID=A0A3R6Y4U7_APHAT|nr:hypothetical protein DYB35_000400 [Aphanomyces astaci]RHZ07086.1 hypothetical protein DYB37_003732 [Aphanomyces astaci]
MAQLNEKLVHNLWAKAKPLAKQHPSHAITKSSKAQSATASPPPPRNIVTRSTAASRASSKAARVVPSSSDRKPSKKKAKTSTKPKSNNKAQLELANKGVVPFLLGKSTHPSFSVIGNAQEALRQSDAFHAVAPDVHPPLHHTAPPRWCRRPADSDDDQDQHNAAEPGGHVRGGGLLSVDTTSSGGRGDTKPTKASFLHTLNKAIQSVDAEFHHLNARYKGLVGTVDSPGVGKTLERTIDELETKGEQLFLLKQLHAQASKSSIFASRTVLHSPDAAAKKAAALRVLHEYRTLDREIKTRSCTS